MRNFDFERVNAQLELVVPHAYRDFLQEVASRRYDLRRFNICYDTDSLIKTNVIRREILRDADPQWHESFLDIGVGDGCGNYFFLHASGFGDDVAQLWAHDPPGIEDVNSATAFLTDLLAEIETSFQGPSRHRVVGSAMSAMPPRPPRKKMIDPFTGETM